MSADYNWHPVSMGKSVFKVETRNLGWWVLLALLISVVFHVVLYVLLSGMHFQASLDEKDEIVWRSQKEQVSIDRDRLNELLAEPVIPDETALKPEKLSELDMVDKSLDEFDLMERIKEETIRLSPIESPKIFSDAVPKAPGQALDIAASSIEISAAEILSKDLAEMRNKLVESSATVSVNQPVLDLNSSDDLGAGADVPANAPVAPQYNPEKVGNDASARPWESQGAAFEAARPQMATGAASGVVIGSALSGSQNWGVPADFDVAGFLAAAQRNFLALQAAWDKGDIATLRSMMTDDMLTEVRHQLAERQPGAPANVTHVEGLEAQLLGIEDLGDAYMASVEFSGMVREEQGAGLSPMREVWNMTKPKNGTSGWLVAGLQALQ